MPATLGKQAHPGARAWNLVACFAFALATMYAVAVVIFRLPFWGGGEERWFRTALALHVELAVFVWLLASMAALWSLGQPARGRFLPGIAALAVAGLALSPLAGGTPVMADYFPWLTDNLVFSASFLLFCLAVIGVAIRSLPTVDAPSAVALLAAPLSAMIVLVRGGALVDVGWAAGHVLLFAHAAQMVREWSWLTGQASGIAASARWSLAALAVSSAVLVPLTYLPGTSDFQLAFTASMRWLLWLPIAVAMLALIGVLRRRTPGEHWVIWLAFAFLSVGLLMGAAIDGATTLVTAHYHAAIGAVVMTRMASSYRFAGQLARSVPAASAARRQMVTYAVGLAMLAGGLALAAIEGAPRKTSAAATVAKGPWYKLGMSVSGAGGLLAMVGAGWLVFNLVRRRDEGRFELYGGHPPGAKPDAI